MHCLNQFDPCVKVIVSSVRDGMKCHDVLMSYLLCYLMLSVGVLCTCSPPSYGCYIDGSGLGSGLYAQQIVTLAWADHCTFQVTIFDNHTAACQRR